MRIDTQSKLASEFLLMARVHSIADDGTLTVCDETGSRQEIPCDVLHTTGTGGPALALGDLVLCWLPSTRAQRGVVLGRVGPMQPPQDPVLPGFDPPDQLVIEARSNLTLRCGEGSITIRADGKILIKGKDLVSHAQRMNRIKGGSVSIN